MVVGVMGAGGIAFGFVPGVRGWFASRPHATVQSDVQARERRPPGRHSPPQAGGREGPRVRGWFASRPHATVQSDVQARERRPPGRHSPPQAGGREGPRVQGWFASRQGPRRSASSGRLRGTRLSLRFAQRCRPGGRRSLLCRRNRTPEHALTRRRGCPAPPNRMRPAPPKPPPPVPATIRPAAGAWLSLAEHLVRDQGVAGSNPAAPTRLVPTDGFRPRRGHGVRPFRTHFSPPFSTQESGCHFGTHPWFKTCIFRRSCRRRFVSAGALFLALAS